MSILERLKGARKSNNGWEAQCPAHEDKHSSLSIAHRDGRWLLNCHAGCSVDAIVSAVGLKVSDLFDDDTRKQKANGKSGSPFIAEYVYKTADGELSRKVCRTADKQFPQFKWTGSAWKGGVEGVPVLPYRLPELAAANVETPVYIVEGEKDCDALARLGFTATTNPMGAGKWKSDLNKYFANRHVLIIPDNDDAGRKHAEQVAHNLNPITASVRVAHLPLSEKGADVSDWLKDDPSGAQLVGQCQAAPLWQPTADKSKDVDAEIKRLAQLSPVQYERERKEAAERLNIRAPILDRLVKAERPDDDKGQGRAVTIDDVPPWVEPVDGNHLATVLAGILQTYAVLPTAAAYVTTLWTLHTWLVKHFVMSPRLAITSPTKGCGKTTILRLLNKLTRRPKRAGSITPSALFRVVEQFQPTILMDENEKYMEHGGDLHALICEGHCVGGTVLRVLGEKLELREFSVYGAVAFARNGRMPDDIEQRSIIIEMQRRLAAEELTSLRDDRSGPWDQAASMCARWAGDVGERVTETDPEMGGLINRVADNWRPLFTIADLIGGEWPARIRQAAAALAPRDGDSTNTLLLADIKTLFDERKGDWADRMYSGMIVDGLIEIEGHPWADFNRKSKKPLTKNQLARLLAEFHIAPGTVKIGEQSLKGYKRSQFEEAWKRYLAPEGVNETSQRHQPTAAGTSATFQNVTEESPVTDRKCEKPLCPNEGDEVTDRKGGAPEDATSGGPWLLVCEHCGIPERPGNPVQSYDKDGQTYLLHPACHAEWLAGPDPDGWSFNLDDAPQAETDDGLDIPACLRRT